MWVLLRWFAGLCLLVLALAIPMNPWYALVLFLGSAFAMLSAVVRVAR